MLGDEPRVVSRSESETSAVLFYTPHTNQRTRRRSASKVVLKNRQFMIEYRDFPKMMSSRFCRVARGFLLNKDAQLITNANVTLVLQGHM